MLSKLRAAAAGLSNAVKREDLMPCLREAFPQLENLRPVAGGTLGVCFEARLFGEWRVFKTHLLDVGKQALEKEAGLLAAVAGERVDVQIARLGRGDESRLWFHMKKLDPRRSLTPSEVRQLASRASKSLARSNASTLVPRSEDVATLVTAAVSLLKRLGQDRLLSVCTQRSVALHVERVAAGCAAWPRVVCHGDLSPANILWDSEGPLAIDWEDACWGVGGYDYLYWLTFFGNRRWLEGNSLGHTELTINDEISLMVVIILLKCGLSVATGEYRRHGMSFDHRLGEVLRLQA